MRVDQVPFRVHDSRKWMLGSLAGHVGVTILFSVLGAAFLTPPPPLSLVQVNLQTMELPAPEPKAAEEEAVTQPPVVEEEVVEETPEPVPPPPQEVQATRPEPKPEENAAPPEEANLAAEPEAPEVELPREAVPVPVPEEEVDFPEPAAVESTPEEPARVQAEPEQVSAGATVQASASEGIDDTYLRLVQQKIGRRWQPTDAATRGLREVTCVVEFRIGAAGQVISPTVTRSSGLSVFDRRALAAVERSAPLPAPPTRFGSSGLEISFLFSYSR